jgi:hypothetical protein
MREINLKGLRVTLEAPIQIAEGVGHCWFPQMAQFPSGELLVSVSIVADAHGLPIHAQDIYISTDRGKTWGHRYTVAEAMTSVKIPRPNGDLLMVPGRVYPDPPGQWRAFSGSYVCYQVGGQQIVIEAQSMRVEGFPRDIKPSAEAHVLPGRVNHGEHCFDGDGLEVEGRLLTTMYLRFRGDELYSTVVFASSDEGRTWRYLSTIAGPEAVPEAPEGPCEPSMVQLETGELMCVMRVGSGPGWHLTRSYSEDGGRSWSVVDRLPAFSVEPSLRRLNNGTLVISSGRPGIYLWLSTDPRGESWQQIDLVAHHNEWAPGPEYTIVPERSRDRGKRHASDQTTAYTELVEVEPNRLLMVYDRTPFGWNPVPRGSDERSRVFVLPMRIECT